MASRHWGYHLDTDIKYLSPAVAGARVKLQQLTRNGVPTMCKLQLQAAMLLCGVYAGILYA